MTIVNPDPHSHGYVFVPDDCILSTFSPEQDVQAVLRELQALGFGGAELQVYAGAAGASALDLTGESHGIAVRFVRNFEALMVPRDGEALQATDAAMRGGGVAVVVQMKGHEAQKEQVAAILRAHGGRFTRYWKRLTTEALD